MQIEKDDVGKYIANVSAQNFESQDIIDAEVSSIKAKKYADACEARLEILRLRKPPPDKSELEAQEVKAVKARAKASKMEAKWKLLTLGQPVKKTPPPARTIVPPSARAIVPTPASGASDAKTFVKNMPVNEEYTAMKQAPSNGKPDGLNQNANEDIAAIRDKLDTLITFSAALPSSEDLIAGSQETAEIKAALQSLLSRPVHIEDPAKNKELADIRQSLNELINKPEDSYSKEQAKELYDIKQAVLQLIKLQETHKDNDCLDEINQIKAMIGNLAGVKGNAENKQSCNLAEGDKDMKEESRELQADIKQVQHEISEVKSGMAALLNHNSSFYFGQLIGKLDALGQNVGSLLGGNLNVGQIMGKLDALGLAQNHPQQPVIVMPPGQPQAQQQPVIVMPPGQPQAQQQPVIVMAPGQPQAQQQPVIVMPPGQPQAQQQPVIVMPQGQPQAQPIFFSTPQAAQPMYQQPQTTIVQQPPVSVGVNNYPDACGNAPPAPVVNNYGQPAYAQPQPAPYAQAAAPAYAQPAPPAQPASAPAAAAAPPAESPVQKMLSEMAGKLDAMKGKK